MVALRAFLLAHDSHVSSCVRNRGLSTASLYIKPSPCFKISFAIHPAVVRDGLPVWQPLIYPAIPSVIAPSLSVLSSQPFWVLQCPLNTPSSCLIYGLWASVLGMLVAMLDNWPTSHSPLDKFHFIWKPSSIFECVCMYTLMGWISVSLKLTCWNPLR